MEIAIIGATGKMGQWMSHFLIREGYKVTAIGRDKGKLSQMAQALDVTATDYIGLAAQADLVIISVPINSFEEVVASLSLYLMPGQKVIDITSIKVSPVAAMHKHLPQATVLGTHPLFGPGAKDIANQNFILTPTNATENALADKARWFLEKRQARVKIMTPEEHDELVAIVLGLAHYIAIVSADTLVRLGHLKEAEETSGTTYRVLLTMIESVISEDPSLYASIQTNLPSLPGLEQVFITCAQEWAEMVASGQEEDFARRMADLRQRFEANSPHFGEAYTRMYNIVQSL